MDDERRGQVEPVGPVLGHGGGAEGAIEQGAGVEAQPLDGFGSQFVVLDEVPQESLVDGVQVAGQEVEHCVPSWPMLGISLGTGGGRSASP